MYNPVTSNTDAKFVCILDDNEAIYAAIDLNKAEPQVRIIFRNTSAEVFIYGPKDNMLMLYNRVAANIAQRNS